jgi:plastocyanin
MKKHVAVFYSSLFLLGTFIAFDSCSSGANKHANRSFIVEIKQMQFQPSELVVQKGDTIVWVNRDIVAHDVTEESTKAWASSSLATGQSWNRVFTESANYYCAIHQVMKGKIVVQGE